MPHVFNWSKGRARKIELLLPRLKYSVYPTNIVQWLENFDTNEAEHMIDLLRIFEYIPFNEFMSRIDNLLAEIFKQVPNVKDRFLIYPYGKVGKSGTLVTYPLRNTSAYKNRESVVKKELSLARKTDYNILSHDYEKFRVSDNIKHVIFLDDFVGSGDTFIKEFGTADMQKWLKEMKISKVFLLASIVMNDAVKKIGTHFPDVTIIAEVRDKVSNTIAKANFLFTDSTKALDLAIKYGKFITGIPKSNNSIPLGYGDSESLVAFFHGTPNNTLPIFWAVANKWKPLFPRNSTVRMEEANRIKKDIRYYLSLFDKIGHDLLEGKFLIDEIRDNGRDRHKELNQMNHAIVTLIYLMSLGLDTIIICQILGLTREDLKVVYNECQRKGLIARQFKLTMKAEKILQEIKMLKKKDSIRNETIYNLEIKKMLYLPQSFNGNT